MITKKPTYNELLKEVYQQSGLPQAEFAKRCKQKPPNIAAYLSPNATTRKGLGKMALLRSFEQYFGWPVHPIREVEPFDGDFSSIPEVPGIYILYDSAGNLIYLGKAKNLRIETKQTYNRKSSFDTRFGPRLKKQRYSFGHFTRYMSLYRIDEPRIRKLFEALLLRVYPNQSHNHNLGEIPP